MSGFEIEFEVSEDVTAALTRAIDAAIDLTPAMGDIAGHLADTTRERFETQVSPAGVPWKPSERFLREGGRILTESGDLSNSIAENWGADFAEAGPEKSGGAGVYALIHQIGGTIRPKVAKALSFAGRLVAKVVIPARPYVGFTDENADYAIDTLVAHIARAFAGDGAAA